MYTFHNPLGPVNCQYVKGSGYTLGHEQLTWGHILEGNPLPSPRSYELPMAPQLGLELRLGGKTLLLRTSPPCIIGHKEIS